MRTIVCRVGQNPSVEETNVSLEDLQVLVGGYIEIIPMDEEIVLIVNEEGRLIPLEFNRAVMDNDGQAWPIYGDFVLVSRDDWGAIISLTDAQIKHWVPRLTSTLWTGS